MTKGKRGNPNWVKGGPSPNPSGKARNDSWVNQYSGHGTARDRLTHTRFALDIVTDTEAMYLWRTEWLCAKVIETRPKEAFRRGYELDLEDKDLAQKVEAFAEELGVTEKVKTAIE